MSVEDLAQKYYTFNPQLSDCEIVLELLLQRDIIFPIMDFQDKKRYVIVDPELTDFVTELYSLCELENEYLDSIWQYLRGPTFNEEQSRRFLYSDESKSKKFFNVRELQRHQFKQAMKNKENINHQILKLLDEKLQEFEKLRAHYIDLLKKKHFSTIDKYPFLREILPIISPPLSEVISIANSQKSTTN